MGTGGRTANPIYSPTADRTGNPIESDDANVEFSCARNVLEKIAVFFQYRFINKRAAVTIENLKPHLM
jgi:hypothetical protein